MKFESLQSLCNWLNNAENICEENRRNFQQPGDLDAFCKAKDVDICDLPVFGPEPSDTNEIFSWDKIGFLVPNDGSPNLDAWVVIPRYK